MIVIYMYRMRGALDSISAGELKDKVREPICRAAIASRQACWTRPYLLKVPDLAAGFSLCMVSFLLYCSVMIILHCMYVVGFLW